MMNANSFTQIQNFYSEMVIANIYAIYEQYALEEKCLTTWRTYHSKDVHNLSQQPADVHVSILDNVLGCMFGWEFDVHLSNNKRTIYNPLSLFSMVRKAREGHRVKFLCMINMKCNLILSYLYLTSVIVTK
jgi:hypothetical protein